ncbi:hypothetical protein [Nonomuraea sp. NPDC049784]|uniref:hypothetical protein n=1 Tax=Nonomuraea sp. NPDC049784 TaxID=3154361 RepID=UPI0033CD737A
MAGAERPQGFLSASLDHGVGGRRGSRRRAHNKISKLEEALRGFFTDHDAMMLDDIDRMAAPLTERSNPDVLVRP